MSLAINQDAVDRVLLADGWHPVAPGTALSMDAYEYKWHADPADHEWSTFSHEPLIPCTGFEFTDAITGRVICGPVTSILAVELDEKRLASLPGHPRRK